MKNIEEMLTSAAAHAAPDVLENILSECESRKGSVIYMEKRKNNTLKVISAIAAVFVLLVAGIFIGKGSGQNEPIAFDDTLAAIVSLDVNPSVELKINPAEKVISAAGLNEDGVKILGDMKLEGTDLNVAVNAVVGSMLKQGYLDEMANSILLSVSGSDGFDADALETRLSTEIDAILTNGAVLSQNVSEADDDVKSISEKYGISIGKAAFIEEIVESNDRHTAKELSSLSINELNLISDSSKLSNVKSEGKASDKAYIGADAALEAALKHAGLKKAEVSNVETELDYEHGCMVYEIEFDCGQDEYDYDVNAVTGEIIAYDSEINGTEHHNAVPEVVPTEKVTTDTEGKKSSKLSEDDAVALALKKAGLSSSKITNLKVKLDKDDGKSVYEIEFKSNGYEYSCDVDALSGKIYDFEREKDDDYVEPSKPAEKKTSSEVISKDEAKAIALKKAGLSADQVGKVYIDLEKDDGKLIYEVEFKFERYEYSAEINALDGSILDYEKELDD